MYSVGKLVNGKFKQVAGNFDILNAPDSSTTTAGFMTPSQVEQLNSAYTENDIADEATIRAIFNK